MSRRSAERECPPGFGRNETIRVSLVARFRSNAMRPARPHASRQRRRLFQRRSGRSTSGLLRGFRFNVNRGRGKRSASGPRRFLERTSEAGIPAVPSHCTASRGHRRSRTCAIHRHRDLQMPVLHQDQVEGQWPWHAHVTRSASRGHGPTHPQPERKSSSIERRRLLTNQLGTQAETAICDEGDACRRVLCLRSR